MPQALEFVARILPIPLFSQVKKRRGHSWGCYIFVMVERSSNRTSKPPPIPTNKKRRTVPPPTPPTNKPPKELGQRADAITKQILNPDHSPKTDELLAGLAAEAEALASDSNNSDSDALANVHVHQALLIRDTGGDLDLVLHHCEQAVGHPIVTSILFSLAQGAKDQAEFDKVAAQLEQHGTSLDESARAEIHAMLADAWLFRFDAAARSAKLAGQAMRVFEKLGSVDTHDLNSTFAISLARLEDWTELEAFHGASGDLVNVAAAAQICCDRLGDEGRTLDHLRRLRESTGELACYSSALESLVMAVSAVDSGETMEALEVRIGKLESEAPSSAELSATRFFWAELQEQIGDETRAFETFDDLSSRPGWSTAVAHLSALRLAAKRRDWEATAAQLGSLATLAREQPLRIAYHRRRAEVLEHCVEDKEEACKAWQQLLEIIPLDAAVHRSLQRLQMDKPKELLDVLVRISELQGSDPSCGLRRAAAVAETRLKDLKRAAELARKCADTSKQSEDLHVLSRLYARQEESESVARVYNEIVSMEADERIAGALLFVGAVHELRAGRQDAALEHIKEAGKRAPKDLATLLLLATIHRTNGANKELRTALERIAELSASDDTRFHTLCELGSVCGALEDQAAARAALAKATKLRPDQVELLLTLADLHESYREWDKAVAVREQAVKALQGGPRSAAVLAQIGRVQDRERNDPVAALKAYERARELDPDNIEVLQSCQRLYGKSERPTKQLAMLREELERVEDQGRRLSLWLDIAEVSPFAKEPASKTLEAYKQALACDANNATALQGLLALALKKSEHKLIAAAFSNATQSASNLQIVCDAHSALNDWTGYVKARSSQIERLDDITEKARAAAELAEIWEKNLKDEAKAVEAHMMVIGFDPVNRKSQAAVRRLLEKGKKWREFVQASEAELKSIEDEPRTASTRVAILLRIAEVRRHELKRESEAALSYEAVLAIDRSNEVALDSLEKLYTSLGRDAELLRVKQALDRGGQASRAREIAELRVRTDDIDGAVEAYQQALAGNPSDREVFTTLEKLCYSHERWTDVMALYNNVILSVEKGESKAYRLGDLYSRRGQVQLKYMNEEIMAAASFLRVIEVDPSDDKAMDNLDAIFSKQSAWEDLIAAYEQRAELAEATELKVESLRKAAEIARGKSNDRAETARLYQALADLNPDDAKANENLEEFYTENQDWSQLVKVLEAQLEKQEAAGQLDQRLLQRLAKIAEESLRDEKRAVRYYQQLSALAPQNRRALDALARIFESTERWTEFVEVTRRLVKVTKDRNVKALLYFKCGSVTEAKFGNEEDAIRYYDAAIKTSPSCLPAVHGQRDCYLRRKDWPRVIQTLELEEKLWQDDKERAGVFSQIGRIYGEELKEGDRAMHYYESALAVDPDCVPANRALFEHFFAEGAWDRAHPLAQALATKAVRDGDPMRRSEFYRKRGVVAQHTGDPVGAAESIVIALEIKPENLDAVVALIDLAAVSPGVYDFVATFRELEKIYRKRGDSDALLSRVMVGQANILTAAGNLRAAEELLSDAVQRCPDDFSIVTSLVDLHASMRNWKAAVNVLENFNVPGIPKKQQIEAMMRQAMLFSDGSMDARLATHTLERILEIDASNPEVHYLLAQELFSLERYEEAKRAIGTVIDLSAVPGANLSPERLARYYYYLGRILQRGGDQRSATSQYRRAAEYDPGYAPPALALAMRSMRAGDQRGAESRLLNSAHAAMGQGDRRSAIPLQRGLARILLRSGDRDAAIEAYRGILEVEPDGAADRLSLAEIYAETDLSRAIDEVWQVIDGDMRHGPAYRVLAGYYVEAGEHERACRVLTTMELLGYSEKKDRVMAEAARSEASSVELTQVLTTDVRMNLMANEALCSVVGELFTLCHEQMSQIYPRASLGDNLVPLPKIEDQRLLTAVGAMSRLFGLDPEVYVGENVPGRVIAIGDPRTIIVLDRVLLDQTEEELMFGLGWAFEGICGGYAPILQLGEKQRRELSALMRSLFMPEGSRNGPTNEFVENLPVAALEILRRHEGEFQDFDMEEWIDGMNASARRAGLLACDDLPASARLLALLAGESIGDHSGGLGKVFCGEDLFHFQMSDQYEQLRVALSRPATAA